MKRLMSGWLLKPSYGTGKSDAKFRVNVCRAQRNVFPGQFAQTHETSALEALYLRPIHMNSVNKAKLSRNNPDPYPHRRSVIFLQKLILFIQFANTSTIAKSFLECCG